MKPYADRGDLNPQEKRYNVASRQIESQISVFI